MQIKLAMPNLADSMDLWYYKSIGVCIDGPILEEMAHVIDTGQKVTVGDMLINDALQNYNVYVISSIDQIDLGNIDFWCCIDRFNAIYSRPHISINNQVTQS